MDMVNDSILKCYFVQRERYGYQEHQRSDDLQRCTRHR